jgi:hypothetical protein
VSASFRECLKQRLGERLRGAAVVALVAAALAGTAVADEADLARLDAARERWQAAAATDYRYGYQKYCDCNRDTPPETVVTVAGGRIVSVHHLHNDSAREVPAREGSLDLYWTIDALFAKLAQAMGGAAVVRAEYDPELGYPTALFIDYSADLIGDETDLRQIHVEIF